MKTKVTLSPIHLIEMIIGRGKKACEIETELAEFMGNKLIIVAEKGEYGVFMLEFKKK